MAFIEERVTRLKTHLLKAITQSKSPSNELHYIAWMNCDNPFNAYALGRAEQQLIHEGKILLDPDDYTLRLVDHPIVEQHGNMIITQTFPCPYCEHTGLTPQGLNNHVNITHPENLHHFTSGIYPEMLKRYQEELQYRCPYCDFTSTSSHGANQHVFLNHPLKHPQFLKDHFPEMDKRFQELQS